MNQFMKYLFDATDSTEQSEAEAQAAQAAKSATQAVEEKLTSEEFDMLWDAIMDIGLASQLDSFTRGFRLGVQLTLEGLQPIAH